MWRKENLLDEFRSQRIKRKDNLDICPFSSQCNYSRNNFSCHFGVRFRVVECLHLTPSRRILSKRDIIPSMHSASGVLTPRNNVFAFHRFLDAAGRHCTLTFVYKILYWHVQRWPLDFIVDNSYVESPLRPHDDGSTRPKEISFRGFWETGMARFLVAIAYSESE